MKTSAPRTARPRWSVTRMRTVIGRVRLTTGFGAKRTWETTSRSPAAFRLSTGTELPVVGGGGCVPPPTTPVGFDSADREPASFRAVTRTRSVLPESLSTTTYWLSVAALISLQFSPAVLQRSHWNEYVIGGSPDPRAAVRGQPRAHVRRARDRRLGHVRRPVRLDDVGRDSTSQRPRRQRWTHAPASAGGSPRPPARAT